MITEAPAQGGKAGGRGPAPLYSVGARPLNADTRRAAKLGPVLIAMIKLPRASRALIWPMAASQAQRLTGRGAKPMPRSLTAAARGSGGHVESSVSPRAPRRFLDDDAVEESLSIAAIDR